MITGKDIYDIALKHFVMSGLELVPYEEATTMHAFYGDIAQKLNESHLAPLIELIRDLSEGLQDCFDNEYSLDQLNDLRGRAADELGMKQK